ncbi:MAG: Rieske 2Fe-2S domain-containing protein [Lautropia sp.]
MWHKVCEVAGLAPASLTETVVNEIPVLVINGRNRCLVVPRSCPHMSASLAEGVFDGQVLTCTKHLWQWSIDDGGSEIGEAEAPLLCYETRESDGVLWARAEAPLIYEHERDE